MKKISVLISLLALFFLVSCTSSLETRFDEYVTQVESDCRDWTEEDWTLSQEEYAMLLQEYEDNYDTLSSEQKTAINKAIGRYNGLLLKQGFEAATDMLQEFGERLPSLIEGFMSAFDKNQDE